MTRHFSLSRLAGLGGVLLLAACSGNVDFTITKHFTADATGGTTYTDTQHVDLAADAPDGWKHRNKIKSLDLVGLDATMTQNVTGNATTGSGSIVLKRSGFADETVGTWTGHAIPAAAPDSIGVTLKPAAMDIINDAIRNDGKFDVVFSGSTAASIKFTADVSLHLKMKFKVP
jgi:hypothetical protein